MKQYTLEQFNKLQKYWQQYEDACNEHDNKIARIEEAMAKDTGIPELEFASNLDGWIFGIGNYYASESDRYPTIDEMYLTGEEGYEQVEEEILKILKGNKC